MNRTKSPPTTRKPRRRRLLTFSKGLVVLARTIGLAAAVVGFVKARRKVSS